VDSIPYILPKRPREIDPGALSRKSAASPRCRAVRVGTYLIPNRSALSFRAQSRHTHPVCHSARNIRRAAFVPMFPARPPGAFRARQLCLASEVAGSECGSDSKGVSRRQSGKGRSPIIGQRSEPHGTGARGRTAPVNPPAREERLSHHPDYMSSKHSVSRYGRASCASMREARSKRSTGPSPSCHCGRGCQPARRTTTSATGRRRSSPP
jgi:hypothetical protein